MHNHWGGEGSQQKDSSIRTYIIYINERKKNALNPFSSQNGFVSDLIVLLSNWYSFCCDFFSNRKAFKMVFPIRSPFLSFKQSDKATFGCVLFSSRKKSFAQSSTFIGYQKKQKKNKLRKIYREPALQFRTNPFVFPPNLIPPDRSSLPGPPEVRTHLDCDTRS
jgi:hypothetical protein